MFPFQPIDISKLSYAAVWDIIAPLFPGATIALGWLYGHPSIWINLHDERVLKIAMALVAAYIAGFVILYVAAFVIGLVALAVLIRQTEFHEPWKNIEWRRLASQFLGPELSPPVDEPPSVPPQQSLPFTDSKSLSEAINESWAKRMAPHTFQTRWGRWFEILKARFPIPQNPRQEYVNVYLSILNSTGWAGLISAYISSTHVNWLIWSGCVLTIIVSNVSFSLNLKQQQYPDPSGDYLAAEMLKAIETRKSTAESLNRITESARD
jgi:hypothetical protein